MPKKHHRVYFAECKDFIKIGSTVKTDIQKHLNDKQTFNPFPIKSLGSIECDCEKKTQNKYGPCSTEEKFHKKFKHLKTEHSKPKHEWFRASQKLRNFIQQHSENRS